jgi:membrane-associated phospholipid phosphatase
MPSEFGMRIHLSVVEQITLAFFAYITVAASVFQLGARDLCLIATLSAVTLATLMWLRRNRQRARWLAAAADLFPALLILVAYRESGLLLTPDPTHHLDFMFIQCDRVLLQNHFIQAVLQAGAPWLQHYLELAYLLCYPLVPLGVAAVYYASRRGAAPSNVTPPSWRHVPAGRQRYGLSMPHSAACVLENVAPPSWRHVPAGRQRYSRSMDDFWTTVLLATLFCYAVYPFFPLTPPRVLFGDVPGPHVEPLLRKLNFWLLDHYSVQACIFPSGHVAAVTAVALAVRKNAPRLGALFVFLAASIALATVYGRYHYAPDALAGALVGVAAYKVAKLCS